MRIDQYLAAAEIYNKITNYEDKINELKSCFFSAPSCIDSNFFHYLSAEARAEINRLAISDMEATKEKLLTELNKL